MKQELNYEFIAAEIGYMLKYDVDFKEIWRKAKAIFKGLSLRLCKFLVGYIKNIT